MSMSAYAVDREARRAALAERRASRPSFGPEETIKAGDLRQGDFVVLVKSFRYVRGNGRKAYTFPTSRFERLSEIHEATGDNAASWMVIDGYYVLKSADVTVRRVVR